MKMGVKWATLPPHVRASIERSAVTCLRDMNEQEVPYPTPSDAPIQPPYLPQCPIPSPPTPSLIPSLAPTSSLPQPPSGLLNSPYLIPSSSPINPPPYLTPRQVSYVIYSFGIMAAPWRDLPPALQTRLEETAVARFPRSVPQGLSNIIYGFSLMGLQWKDHSDSYRAAAYASLVKVRVQEIACHSRTPI